MHRPPPGPPRWCPTPSHHNPASGWVPADHDNVIKREHFPRYWPFVWEFTGHRWIPPQRPVTLEPGYFLAWPNNWVHNRDVGDSRRHHAHYDVTLMFHRRAPGPRDPKTRQGTRTLARATATGWSTPFINYNSKSNRFLWRDLDRHSPSFTIPPIFKHV